MARKNPENKPLRISACGRKYMRPGRCSGEYARMLSSMLIAQSNLVKAGKDSAMPHFIAIVKELEEIFDFRFEQVTIEPTTLTAEERLEMLEEEWHDSDTKQTLIAFLGVEEWRYGQYVEGKLSAEKLLGMRKIGNGK